MHGENQKCLQVVLGGIRCKKLATVYRCLVLMCTSRGIWWATVVSHHRNWIRWTFGLSQQGSLWWNYEQDNCQNYIYSKLKTSYWTQLLGKNLMYLNCLCIFSRLRLLRKLTVPVSCLARSPSAPKAKWPSFLLTWKTGISWYRESLTSCKELHPSNRVTVMKDGGKPLVTIHARY